MEKIQRAVNEKLKVLANAMVEQDASEWPPFCGLFMYLPARPQHNDNDSVQNESLNNKNCP